MRLSVAASITVLVTMLGIDATARERARLPTGYQSGRCLYVVDGEPRISGFCTYKANEDRSFGINGPHNSMEVWTRSIVAPPL